MASDATSPPSQEETTGTLLSSSIEVSDGSMFFEFERGLDDGGVTIPSSGEMNIIHARGSDEDDLGYHDGESTVSLPYVYRKSTARPPKMSRFPEMRRRIVMAHGRAIAFRRPRRALAESPHVHIRQVANHRATAQESDARRVDDDRLGPLTPPWRGDCEVRQGEGRECPR